MKEKRKKNENKKAKKQTKREKNKGGDRSYSERVRAK